jgi:hypothetical protein
MDLFSWIVLALTVLGLFALWDLVFCGGRRCGGSDGGTE